MNGLEAAFLGILQGITEFLPISSSGHLVLAQAWLGIQKENILFEVFAHFGTFLAVVLVFREDIGDLIQSFFRWCRVPHKSTELFANDPSLRLLLYILTGTIPAGIFGYLLEDYFEQAFSKPLLVSIMLLITGLILLSTHWARSRHNQTRLSDAIGIGFAQALAILPGISRSGSTISIGMHLGLEKNEAARFSFLLSLPAIAGATMLKTLEIFDQNMTVTEWQTIGIGFLFSFVAGYASIRFLLSVIRRGKFSYFAIYCFLLGVAGLLYFA